MTRFRLYRAIDWTPALHEAATALEHAHDAIADAKSLNALDDAMDMLAKARRAYGAEVMTLDKKRRPLAYKRMSANQ